MEHKDEYVIVAKDKTGYFHWHAQGEKDYLSRRESLENAGVDVVKIYRDQSCEEARQWIEDHKSDLKPIKKLDEL